MNAEAVKYCPPLYPITTENNPSNCWSADPETVRNIQETQPYRIPDYRIIYGINFDPKSISLFDVDFDPNSISLSGVGYDSSYEKPVDMKTGTSQEQLQQEEMITFTCRYKYNEKRKTGELDFAGITIPFDNFQSAFIFMQTNFQGCSVLNKPNDKGGGQITAVCPSSIWNTDALKSIIGNIFPTELYPNIQGQNLENLVYGIRTSGRPQRQSKDSSDQNGLDGFSSILPPEPTATPQTMTYKEWIQYLEGQFPNAPPGTLQCVATVAVALGISVALAFIISRMGARKIEMINEKARAAHRTQTITRQAQHTIQDQEAERRLAHNQAEEERNREIKLGPLKSQLSAALMSILVNPNVWNVGNFTIPNQYFFDDISNIIKKCNSKEELKIELYSYLSSERRSKLSGLVVISTVWPAFERVFNNKAFRNLS